MQDRLYTMMEDLGGMEIPLNRPRGQRKIERLRSRDGVKAADFPEAFIVDEALRKELDIEVGGTTPDRLFSLDIGRCFGACGIAPVVMVGDDVHQRVRPNKIAAMLQPYLENTDESEEENA